jgi:hypothetical protein
MKSTLAMSFVIQLAKKRSKSGTTSAKCAKLNGKTMSNHAEPSIQNAGAASPGRRETFLLSVTNRASGPAVPARIEP